MAVVRGLGIPVVESCDYTLPGKRSSTDVIRVAADTVVIIGVPVYEEHIPQTVGNLLQKIQARQQPTVICAVYGNIGFGRALLELYDLAVTGNLQVVGAMACIGEHSFSSETASLASGRPDDSDLLEVMKFGEALKENLAKGKLSPIFRKDIPRSLPVMARILPGNSAKLFVSIPSAAESCKLCGTCAACCPAGAIRSDMSIDYSLCQRCFACVRRCPVAARAIVYRFPLVGSVLRKMNTRRKRNLFIIQRS